MADRTKIEWADATWNTIGGCTRVDEGCRNCYAEVMAARFNGPGQWGEGLARIVTSGGKADHRWTGKVTFRESALTQPLRWRKPRYIFVNSTADTFHESVPDEWIDRQFAVMAICPQHIFMLLTKRPERARAYTSDPGLRHRIAMTIANVADLPPEKEFAAQMRCNDMPLPNVWIGTSISDQASADLRIPQLLATPAAVRFVSAEPLLGPVEIKWALPDTRSADCPRCGGGCDATDLKCSSCNALLPVILGLDLVIVGGESGPGARPMHLDWARRLRDQCVEAGVPLFFKQWGMWLHESAEEAGRWNWDDADARKLLHVWPDGTTSIRLRKIDAGRLLDGREWSEMPGVAG